MTIALTVLLSLPTAQASFSRLWVGFKKKDVSTTSFIDGLNLTFFKDTIQVGQRRGLQSYQPYITSMKPDVPDELALVVYESEARYRAIRSTPEGEKYSAAHWDFFDKETSKSTVSEPFLGELKEAKAYELSHKEFNWQHGHTTVFIYARPADLDLTKLAQDFSALRSQPETFNSILMVSKDWIIEYRSLSSDVSGEVSAEALPLHVLERKTLPHSHLEDLRNTVGNEDGINFLF